MTENIIGTAQFGYLRKVYRMAWLRDAIDEKIKDLDCVLAFETASDYLGTNKMSYRPSVCIYAKEDPHREGVDCTVVDSFDGMDIVEVRGLRCTSERQTLFDLLRNDRDSQVTVEAVADWYFRHSESFEGLDVPADIQDVFDSYVDDAIHYYDC